MFAVAVVIVVVSAVVVVLSLVVVGAAVLVVVVVEAVVVAVVLVVAVAVVWIGPVASPRRVPFSTVRPTDVWVMPSPGAECAIHPDSSDARELLDISALGSASVRGGRGCPCSSSAAGAGVTGSKLEVRSSKEQVVSWKKKVEVESGRRGSSSNWTGRTVRSILSCCGS